MTQYIVCCMELSGSIVDIKYIKFFERSDKTITVQLMFVDGFVLSVDTINNLTTTDVLKTLISNSKVHRPSTHIKYHDSINHVVDFLHEFIDNDNGRIVFNRERISEYKLKWYEFIFLKWLKQCITMKLPYEVVRATVISTYSNRQS